LPERVMVKFDCGQTVLLEEVQCSVGAQGLGFLRTQLPLRLAWAFTIHKAQGMSLSRAELSLAGAFECGQVYVALSRVRSLEGLWLRDALPRGAVRVNPKVLEYYRGM